MPGRQRVLTPPSCDAPLFARVVAAARALRGVEVTERYDGATVLQHDGRFMAGAASHVSAEPDSLVIKTSPDERDRWLQDAPDVYYVTAFYEPHPVVLVRLRRVDDGTLSALLAIAWHATARTRAARHPRGRATNGSGI